MPCSKRSVVQRSKSLERLRLVEVERLEFGAKRGHVDGRCDGSGLNALEGALQLCVQPLLNPVPVQRREIKPQWRRAMVSGSTGPLVPYA